MREEKGKVKIFLLGKGGQGGRGWQENVVLFITP